MKEFLILKKIDASVQNGVNCAVKLNFDKNSLNISGEIYSASSLDGDYKIYLTNGTNCVTLLDGVLKFEKQLGFEFLSGGYILLFRKDDAILYGTYKKVDFPLQRALETINEKEEEYNDYEIATENYYEGEIYETERIYNGANGGDCQDKEEKDQEETSGGALLYENVAIKSQGGNFYDRVREKFEEVISSHKKDEEIKKIIPNSEFCKICYDNDRYYSVGRVFEGDKVKYVCYAVKGSYAQTPNELKRFCKFIPISPFLPLSNGYYVIFQDAESGEIIEN
ncbi:MAG: hypothetical protein E7358_05610 [Clostridiales bacterium]|nr:hypothetical protein [Clostridiales bacterium]